MRFLGFLAVSLIFFAPSPSSAEFQFQPSALTIEAGPAMLDNNVGTTLFLASRVDLGTFTPRLVWDAGLHWWQKSESTSFTFFGTTSETEVRYRDIALTSGVKYLFPVKSTEWLPFARGGLGLNFVNVKVRETVDNTTTAEASGGDTDLGIYLGGGINYRHSQSLLFGVEGTFNITDADHFLLGFGVQFPIGSGSGPRATE